MSKVVKVMTTAYEDPVQFTNVISANIEQLQAEGCEVEIYLGSFGNDLCGLCVGREPSDVTEAIGKALVSARINHAARFENALEKQFKDGQISLNDYNRLLTLLHQLF